jgi:hypothetical protein
MLLLFYRLRKLDGHSNIFHPDYSCQPLAQGRIVVAPYTSDC